MGRLPANIAHIQRKPYVKMRVELLGGMWLNMQRSYGPKTVFGHYDISKNALKSKLSRSGAAASKHNAYAAKALCKSIGRALGGHVVEHAKILRSKNNAWAL